jgi:hypothetical protein
MCNLLQLNAIYRAVSCTLSSDITLSVAALSGSQNLITGGAQALTFSATDNTLSRCGTIQYQVTYSPASATMSLISSTTTSSVLFAASSNVLDANTYTVTVSARYSSQTTWLTSATTTYNYVNPCTSATIISTSFSSLLV